MFENSKLFFSNLMKESEIPIGFKFHYVANFFADIFNRIHFSNFKFQRLLPNHGVNFDFCFVCLAQFLFWKINIMVGIPSLFYFSGTKNCLCLFWLSAVWLLWLRIAGVLLTWISFQFVSRWRSQKIRLDSQFI